MDKSQLKYMTFLCILQTTVAQDYTLLTGALGDSLFSNSLGPISKLLIAYNILAWNLFFEQLHRLRTL